MINIKKLLPLALSCIFLQPAALQAQQQQSAEEIQYRPNFHFTPKANWMNDPNGLFYSEGIYHLYFQYWPYGNVWGPMHWGHATSKDLIKWEEQPIALYPDRFGYIFSGSATVDLKNTSGFGDGKTAPVVAIFTYCDPSLEKAGKDAQSQGIAYSLDNGFTWSKYDEGNPVIKSPGIKDFRDPKVTWDSEHNQWVLVLAAQDKAQFYSSDNLKDWKYLSDFGVGIGAHGGVWECPDLFQLKVEGSNETKWVLLQSLNPGGANGGSGTQYFIGNFDGKTFSLDKSFEDKIINGKAAWLDYGRDNYAGVTWNNVPDSEGRKIMIGWMSNWDYATVVPTQGWRSSMTVPRELKLQKFNGSYRLLTAPVKAIENYSSNTLVKEKIKVKDIVTLATGETIDFTAVDIQAELRNLKSGIYSFVLSNAAGEKLTFGLDNKGQFLFIDRTVAGKKSFSEKFANTVTKAVLDKVQKEGNFRVLLDKTSIEIFYNDGETVLTEIFFTSKPFDKLTITGPGGEIKKIKFNQLKFNK
ncbi:glycoside hydrolase family 32 protein [Flavobacterium sp. Sd200]|uniref:glycoside hydrolase family 32 protein n=1 Tax=Flavobacterium sp. Sd200 TaxID=2692211 RepID=UPI0013689DF0|nr:glycoside hydrolase family 32 protein [Flavobacterium sp. Sd200]MXN91663.1 glycoside hydrolase family 32 protein [Flavobacterium sp. Sd200]